MPNADLAPLDLAIIGIYLIGIVVLGVALSRKRASAEDFFLASRASTWPVIGLALLASNISSNTLVGLAGAAYATGIAVYNYEWMAAVVLVFFVFFFLPFLLRSGVYTLPEFLERRYDRVTRTYFSALTLFLNIVVDTASALYGGGLLFSLILPDVPFQLVVAAIALSAGIYTVAGGLRSVIVTEVIQAVILLGASVVVAVLAFDRAGGWANIVASVPAEKLSLIRPIGDPDLPWPGLFGVALLGFYFWCTNQFMTQRVLSAKDENHGRWGSLFAGFLKLPILFLMVLPGTAAILIYPRLETPDLVYPTLLFDLLPTGLLGLALAGFLAALMSSIASTFNSASTLFTMDFARPARPGISGAALVRIGRIATVVFAVAAVLWAPQIRDFPSLWQYLQTILAYTAPPVAALYVLGLFWPRANAAGARAAIVAGLVVGAALFAAGPVAGAIDIHFLYVALLLFAVAALAHVAGSLTGTAPSAEKLAGLLWSREFYRAETAALAAEPWWRNYRVLAAGLLAITFALVAVFA